MYLPVVLSILSLLLTRAHALYFYLEGSQMRCFLEDLPKDTLVVGTHPLLSDSDAQGTLKLKNGTPKAVRIFSTLKSGSKSLLTYIYK
jgi:hypothetical protein